MENVEDGKGEEQRKIIRGLIVLGALSNGVLFSLAVFAPDVITEMAKNLGNTLIAYIVVLGCCSITLALLILTLYGLCYMAWQYGLFLWKERVWKKQSFFGRNMK